MYRRRRHVSFRIDLYWVLYRVVGLVSRSGCVFLSHYKLVSLNKQIMMKCFAAVTAGVMLGAAAPAMAFVHGGGAIAASSQSRCVCGCSPSFSQCMCAVAKGRRGCSSFCVCSHQSSGRYSSWPARSIALSDDNRRRTWPCLHSCGVSGLYRDAFSVHVKSSLLSLRLTHDEALKRALTGHEEGCTLWQQLGRSCPPPTAT